MSAAEEVAHALERVADALEACPARAREVRYQVERSLSMVSSVLDPQVGAAVADAFDGDVLVTDELARTFESLADEARTVAEQVRMDDDDD